MTDRSQVENDGGVARLEYAIEDLERANKAYRAALSGANARGELNSYEVKQCARTLKRYTRVLRRKDPAEIEELAALYNRLAAEIEQPGTGERSSVDEARSSEWSPSHALSLVGLSEKQVLGVSEKWKVVSVMLQGYSVREALDRTGLKRSMGWARRAYVRFKADGILGLLDRRRHNGSAPTVLTPTVVKLMKELHFSCPDISTRRLHWELSRLLFDQGLPVPCYETVRRWRSKLPEELELISIRGCGPQAKPLTSTEYLRRRLKMELRGRSMRSNTLSGADTQPVKQLATEEHATRRVTRTGIRLTVEGVTHVYWSSALHTHLGCDVHLRFNPEKLESIRAFAVGSGAFIGEIPRLAPPPSSLEDVLEARRRCLDGMRRRDFTAADSGEPFSDR